ncbi:MAG: DNA mismatch repair protein MutS [Paludibacteraceae bacterium]|nr:DNA mismatch repair protein MutS [Paludibacteraceae bacterium]
MANETPMMKQFNDIKAQYPDAMLLFRCGDFYETYCEDAVRASKVLGITLTHRSSTAGTSSSAIEMAGFPFHALDTYLPKLVRAGMRVAICDQLEDPKLTKKLVKRGVTELVTPGVSYSDTTLSGRENNFVACVHFNKSAKRDEDAVGLSFLDISTGEFLVAQGSETYAEKLLTNFMPKEVLFLRQNRAYFESLFGSRYFTFELEDWMLTEQAAQDRLCKQFGTTGLKGFGVDRQPLGVVAAGGILHYLDMTQHLQTGHITALSRIEEDKYMWLDKFSLRNLELFPDMVHPEAMSLLQVIDRTSSPMGARLLKRWLSLPLKSVRPIKQRQEVVEFFFRHPEERERIRECIGQIADLERIISKVSTGRISPREMLQLSISLEALEPIKEIATQSEGEYMRRLGGQLKLCKELRHRIRRTMSINPPSVQGRPEMIGQGVDAELDELRAIKSEGKDFLMKIQQREVENTGITSLKIGFNNVFGYYLEVRNTFKEQVPQTWIRKQTLVNAERYITEELKSYEEKILGAEDKIQMIENRIFTELILATVEFVPTIQLDATIVAQLDCLLSFADTAQQNNYICPDVNDSLIIDIKGGRHPVIEQNLPMGERYIPNDIYLSNDLKASQPDPENPDNQEKGPSDPQQIIVITGPNMAGKSALLRQTALIVLLAQIGSYVPADAAKIGIIDKIFTRVGASDNISMGESTFMVEMNEASAILNNLSQRSLVLFDELGRGTSTFDGISIAWSIVEYIHENRFHAKTLFATHYHELNDMASLFARIRNYNVSVREVNKKVIFLRKLVPGGSAHSFGIHVAKLAGMPQAIIDRAEVILHQLEAQSLTGDIGRADSPQAKAAKIQMKTGGQLSFFQLDDPVLSEVRDRLLKLDINNLTPLEALTTLNELKKITTGK